MPVANHFDNLLRLNDRLLDELPWAAALVDPTGRICFANRLTHQLLGQHPAALHDRQITDYIMPDSAEALQVALRTERSAMLPISLQPTLNRQVSQLHCVVQPIDGSIAAKPLLLLTLAETAPSAANVLAALSQAAACLDAPDYEAVCDQLRTTLAALNCHVHVLLRAHESQHESRQLHCAFTTVDAVTQAYLERSLNDSFVQLLIRASGVQLPCADSQATNAAMLPDESPDTALPLYRTVGNALFADTCTISLSAAGEQIGFLLLSGPGMKQHDQAALAPFGRLFGMAFDRLKPHARPAADQAHVARLLTASQAIISATKLDDVLRTICEQALILSGGTFAAVWTPEGDTRHLRCVMALGNHSDHVLGRRAAINQSIVGRVFRGQEQVIVDEPPQQPDADPEIKTTLPLRSGLFASLKLQQRTVGVLAIGHEARGAFDSTQLNVVEQFSVNAAVAIENAQLHEAMRRSEERYRTLFQNALEIVLTLDLEGRIIGWNPAALQFLGMSPAEMWNDGVNFYDVLSDQTAPRLRELMARTLRHEPSLPTALHLRRANGSTAIVEVTTQLLEERGQPVGVYVIGRDMTERYHQRRALTTQVAQLTALHQLSVALSASLDRQAILQRASEALTCTDELECAAIFLPDPSHQRLELVAASGIDQEASECAARIGPNSLLWQAWQEGRAITGKHHDVQPRYQPLFNRLHIRSFALLPLITANRTLGVMAIGSASANGSSQCVLQVLETMASQIAHALDNLSLYDAAEQSATRYRDLYENANDCIGTMTLHGQLLSLNHAALRLLGYAPSDVPQLSLADLLVDDTRVECVLEALRQDTMSATAHELNVVRKDGTHATVEIRSRLVLEQGTPSAIHFIARDVTERRLLEMQLRQGEKLAALGQLVAGVAHELNNPLAVVMGNAQLLLRDPAAAPFADDVRNIEAAAQRAKHIVKQMLTFAREQDESRTPVDVPALVERVVRSLHHRLPGPLPRIDVEIPATVPPIWGDAYQLEQVLANVLDNSVQALAETASPSQQITVSAYTAMESVCLRVADNGPGIPTHILPRIFDPFFSTKEVGKGTGLGLSLAYGIIDKHGGTIMAESIPGTGATFTIKVPMSQTSVEPAPDPLATKPTNSTILIVEDENDVRLIVQRALTQHGYIVEAVDSAEAALPRVNNKRYDLVISDLRMPGMSGNELFEQVRASQPHLNWVFITGDTMNGGSESFLQNSGMPHLTKPFTLDELWEAVATSMLGAQLHQPVFST